MPVTRDEIVSAARKYLDTPFLDKGRRCGHGIDCVGLPIMVAADLGLKDRRGAAVTQDYYSEYPSQPVGHLVHRLLCERLVQKPFATMKPGDVVSINMSQAACHAAMVTEVNGRLCLLHAYSGGPNKVVEHLIDRRWQQRIVGCFRFPEVED